MDGNMEYGNFHASFLFVFFCMHAAFVVKVKFLVLLNVGLVDETKLFAAGKKAK